MANTGYIAWWHSSRRECRRYAGLLLAVQQPLLPQLLAFLGEAAAAAVVDDGRQPAAYSPAAAVRRAMLTPPHSSYESTPVSRLLAVGGLLPRLAS